MFNLRSLERKLDVALGKETKESLTNWLKKINNPLPPPLPERISHVVYPFEGYEKLTEFERTVESWKAIYKNR